MRLSLAALFLVVLSGCGVGIDQAGYPVWPSPIPAIMEPYLVDYLDDSARYNVRASDRWIGSGSFAFAPGPGSNIAGVCFRSYRVGPDGKPTDDGQWSITINQDQWVNFDSEQRSVLMYHEMGHCLNHYPHREGNTAPYGVSIMYPYVWGTGKFDDSREAYVYELFTGSWPSSAVYPTLAYQDAAKSDYEQPEEHHEDITCDVSGQCVKEVISFIHRKDLK